MERPEVVMPPEMQIVSDQRTDFAPSHAEISSFASRLTEAADQRAVFMHSTGESWKANRLALQTVGIDAPRGNACDIEKIPGMEKLAPGAAPQPGDVYTTGADAKHPNGYSFIVNAEGQAVSDHFAKFPNLGLYKDVKHFRKIEN